jgi:hypothetical protein
MILLAFLDPWRVAWGLFAKSASPGRTAEYTLVKRLTKSTIRLQQSGTGCRLFWRNEEFMSLSLGRLAVVLSLFLTCVASAGPLVLPEGMSDIEKKRFERFKTFHINGVCGARDLKLLAGTGINTFRGYTINSDPKVMIAKLDEAHRLGIMMVVSEWMPKQGTNKGRDGKSYEFDYNTRGDQMVSSFTAKVEGIGDHPAILMWGLGNEVPLEEPYLRTVNRMSLAVHERFPHHITSLTIVNAKPDKLELIKKFAPDIDVVGIQSYSRGAVRKAIKNAEQYWGKPFYVSEFNGNGPWHFKLTDWGVSMDEPATNKVRDIKDMLVAIDESNLCLGSTAFLWGHATTYRPTYFSLLLDPNPNGTGAPQDQIYRTPQADAMVEHFTGKPIEGNRAPVLTKLQFEGGSGSRLAKPGETMRIEFAAEDGNGDTLEYVTWILDSTATPTKSVAGPFPQTSGEHAMIAAPQTPGEYLLMVYAIDNKGGGSASTLAFKVPDAEKAPEAK